MSYIDILIEIEKKLDNNASFLPNEKSILIGMIEKEQALEHVNDDPFKYFYSDVTNREDIFDFKNNLNDLYGNAQDYAKGCVDIFISFSRLEANERLYNWLSNAIKFVDCIIIDYIQELLQQEFINNPNLGKERSRYAQINKKEIDAQIAGRIMDNLYSDRSKLEHRTKNDPINPGKQILVTPRFSRIKRRIERTFPKALEKFDAVYKEFYKAN